MLEQNSQLTLEELIHRISEQFSVDSSTTALHRALKLLNVTWKNILPIPIDWNTPRVIEARFNYVMSMHGLQNRPLIFIDETGFNLHCKKSKGRAVSGEKAILTLVPKGKRVTVIAALSMDGICHSKIVNIAGGKKGTNADDFRGFLFDLIGKIPSGSVLIMDNCKIHHAEVVEGMLQMIKRSNGIDIVFLPPYSPFLNPIEYAFNYLKGHIAESDFRNRGELLDRIQMAIPTVTGDMAKSFIQESSSYFPQVLLKIPFDGKPLDPQFSQQPQPQQAPHQEASQQPQLPLLTQ